MVTPEIREAEECLVDPERKWKIVPSSARKSDITQHLCLERKMRRKRIKMSPVCCRTMEKHELLLEVIFFAKTENAA